MLHIKTDAPPSAGARPPFRGHDEIYGNNPISNSNDLRQHIVNIDSRFRKSQQDPSSDFLYAFAKPYKNVIQARVASVEIPTGFYQFSQAKRNTSFRIDVLDHTATVRHLLVTIPDGDYTGNSLISTIQTQFAAVANTYGIILHISLDAISRRTTITLVGSAAPPALLTPTPTTPPLPFGICFATDPAHESRPHDFGLGYQLGFTNHRYQGISLVSESLLSTQSDNYFLLAIDDFYTVEHMTNDTYIQCLAKILLKPGLNGILYDDGYTVLSNEIIFPRPNDLKQVRVRLLDSYGQPVDMHRMNFSISLEITEVMNVQLYDSYRTYLWNKEEPRGRGRNLSSSQAGRSFN
jgi:hypothetical protein